MANPPPLRCGIWLHHQFKNKNALYEHAAATARRGNRSYIFLDDGFIHTIAPATGITAAYASSTSMPVML